MILRILFIVILSFGSLAQADEKGTEVQIAEAYIELHTGPGRGYPIFYVIDRGETITVIKRKNNWFKIAYNDDVVGWTFIDQLEKTLAPDGKKTAVASLSRDEFNRRRGEVGVLAGAVGGTDSLTLYGGYAFTRNLSTELSISQAVGSFSNNIIINANLLHQAFPQWRYSPFFAMGIGNITTTPRATLVQAEDSSDMIVHIGFGLRHYISNSFALRAEYNNYVVFSSDDRNEEIDEWKIGLVSFF